MHGLHRAAHAGHAARLPPHPRSMAPSRASSAPAPGCSWYCRISYTGCSTQRRQQAGQAAGGAALGRLGDGQARTGGQSQSARKYDTAWQQLGFSQTSPAKEGRSKANPCAHCSHHTLSLQLLRLTTPTTRPPPARLPVGCRRAPRGAGSAGWARPAPLGAPRGLAGRRGSPAGTGQAGPGLAWSDCLQKLDRAWPRQGFLVATSHSLQAARPQQATMPCPRPQTHFEKTHMVSPLTPASPTWLCTHFLLCTR